VPHTYCAVAYGQVDEIIAHVKSHQRPRQGRRRGMARI